MLLWQEPSPRFLFAGMRVGYLIAKPELLEKIGQFGLGDYGLNQTGVAGALATYNDEKFLASRGRRSSRVEKL